MSSAQAPSITLCVDDRPCTLPEGITLAQLIAQLGHAPHEVGTAVNGVFVARADRETRSLHTNDAVMLFKPIVGG